MALIKLLRMMEGTSFFVMAKIVDGMPQPKSHIKTLAKIGYNFNSAISDIIDNSITAEAENINIKCPPSDNPYILIIDDGIGMKEDSFYLTCG